MQERETPEQSTFWVIKISKLRPMKTDRAGPFNWNELRSAVLTGNLASSDLIEKEGSGERLRADEVPDLKELFDDVVAGRVALQSTPTGLVVIGTIGIIIGGIVLVVLLPLALESLDARTLLPSTIFLAPFFLMVITSLGLLLTWHWARGVARFGWYAVVVVIGLFLVDVHFIRSTLSSHVPVSSRLGESLFPHALFAVFGLWAGGYLGKARIRALFRHRQRGARADSHT